jgi:hypothetical protein
MVRPCLSTLSRHGPQFEGTLVPGLELDPPERKETQLGWDTDLPVGLGVWQLGRTQRGPSLKRDGACLTTPASGMGSSTFWSDLSQSLKFTAQVLHT